jgi:pyruvate dehydrogenase E2 component (dihydrolipoamide acetyltransferase)
MPFYFKLPDLGEGITEGEVVKWLVKPGDPVEEHQPVMEVETDKAIVEVPSPRAGTVLKLARGEGELVRVGELLLVIGLDGEGAAVSAAGELEEEGATVVGALPEAQGVLASPKARGIARDLGVELSHVRGTGPGGTVTEKDVRATFGEGEAEQRPPAEAALGRGGRERPSASAGSDSYGPVERVPVKGIRRAIAKNLLASQRTAASVTGMEEADITGLWDLRRRERKVAAESGIHLTFLPFFMKAVCHALEVHPMLNASMDEASGEIVVKRYYNIGVAVDTPDGLMVAVIREVGSLTILELAQRLQEISKRARERRITLEELKGSSFTISNYGAFGGGFATPIINHPDVAILGTGRIRERPWVVGGEVAIRRILPLSLTFDHRVVDGVEAARFLVRVVQYLEDPGRIFIESS